MVEPVARAAPQEYHRTLHEVLVDIPHDATAIFVQPVSAASIAG